MTIQEYIWKGAVRVACCVLRVALLLCFALRFESTGARVSEFPYIYIYIRIHVYMYIYDIRTYIYVRIHICICICILLQKFCRNS